MGAMAISQLPSADQAVRPGWAYLPLRNAASEAGEATVGRVLAQVATRHPRRMAIVWADDGKLEGVTWGELYREASAIGAALQRLRPANRRVGIVGHDRLRWIRAFYGAACAGYGVVPMPLESDDLLAERCAQVKVDHVLVARAGEIAVDRVRGAALVYVDDLMGAVAPTGSTDGPAGADGPFLYQFTSGTTGRPKTAVLSHRAALGSAEFYARATGAPDGGIMLNPLPLEHVGGSVAGVLSALAIGGTYAVVDRIEPDRLAKIIRLAAPDVVGLVPAILLDLVEDDAVESADFASVATIVGGATNVDPGLIDRVESELGVRFLVGYGQSEAPCLSLSGIDDPLTQRTRTVGRPLPGRDYCIAAGDGSLAHDGEVGELCVRGPLVMSGYLADDTVTKETDTVTKETDGEGWLRTGDLCSMTNGVLSFHSRLRDVVIRGGENLYPAEIEPVIIRYPGVREVAVFGVPDSRLGETLAAAVVSAPGTAVDFDDLDAFLADRLPRRRRPGEWFAVDDLPRTSTGKVRKAELAAWCRKLE